MNIDVRSKPVDARALPDMEICRATPLTTRLAECLVERPMGCQYAMSWGYTFLCGHPDRNLIIASTRREREQNGQEGAQ